MFAILWNLMLGLFSIFLARVMIGAALSLVIYENADGYVNGVILEFENYLQGFPADAMAIMARAGLGEVLDILISVLIGVASVAIAQKVVGVKVVGS